MLWWRLLITVEIVYDGRTCVWCWRLCEVEKLCCPGRDLTLWQRLCVMEEIVYDGGGCV